MTAARTQKISFSTKAGTLEGLQGKLRFAKTLPLVRFTVEEFLRDRDGIVARIRKEIPSELLIVRSSARNEDEADVSNAGHFRSIPNVSRTKADNLDAAIEKVIESYDDPSGEHEVFVQPMLEDMRSAGVAFTADLATLAPYDVINIDDAGSFDAITSGAHGSFTTYVRYKHAPGTPERKDLAALVTSLRELEQIFSSNFLDVEFAFDAKEDLYILQVRPLSLRGKEDLSELRLDQPLRRLHEKITNLSSAHPNLLGDRAVYGVMPDWNPAEIIGFRPKMLAASLYKEIVTDNIWAYQRDNYGYRNLRSHPLMQLFIGVPYIDVRVDFNSFIPKQLDESVAARLVNFYLEKLVASPVLHDKVEFEIVHSCFYFNVVEKLREQLAGTFSEDEILEIARSLRDLTNTAIHPEHALYKADLAKIETLKSKYDSVENSDLSKIDKVYWLIEDCKRYGTLPFAGVARSAFIATQFLKSFVELGILTPEEQTRFSNSLHTVTRRLQGDLVSYAQGRLSRNDFLGMYGHLRPGTYDIQSERYDADFEGYFCELPKEAPEPTQFEFTGEQLRRINRLIAMHGLQTDAEELIRFVRESIEGREYAKFVFTRSLSRALGLLEELGAETELSRDDLAHLDVRTVMNLYASLDHRDFREVARADIEKNKRAHAYTRAIRLPALITDPKDVYEHFVHPEDPNFVTMKSVSAPIEIGTEYASGDLEGKIVFIKSADPGYDFLFTKGICGLVTMFGGANSHMAVRCAELGIPAVIGAGEKNFEHWSKASMIMIDCANRQVRVLS